jgi:hypothetical protein
MDNKKFEQLIDLIINENEEQARALFHDIVVEKSREIYENIMSEEMEEEGMHMGGQVGEMMDEISAEQEGMVEAEDEEIDFDDDGDEEIIDIDSDQMHDEEADGEVEDAVIRIEDKLDQLMADFEKIMGGDEGMGDAVDFHTRLQCLSVLLASQSISASSTPEITNTRWIPTSQARCRSEISLPSARSMKAFRSAMALIATIEATSFSF